MEQTKPVAGYFRVSLARDNMHAPELYEDEIERYCAYRKVRLAKLYSDIDYSAFRGAKPRPSLTQLIGDRQSYSAIVIPKLSRFGRSMKELIRLFDIFDSDNIPLVFLDMNLDTSTSQGRLLRHILAAFAEYESDVKADYARANQRLIAQAGRPHGPLAPYGYTVVGKGSDKTYVVDEPRAAIVVEIFERYASGKEGFSKIARVLNERGVAGVKGGRWARERIRTLIDNPAYVGLRRHDGETFPATWPPIVERELWERVRARRDANRQVQRRAPEHGLLSGLIVCGVCGKKLNWHTAHEGRRVYECRASFDFGPRCLGGQITAGRAEKLATGALFELLGMVRDPVLQERAAGMTGAWPEASATERRELLRLAMDGVALLPRPADNRHGKGQRMGRSIRITWARPWSEEIFGYASAGSVLGPRTETIVSSKGKTWAQWQRQVRATRLSG